MMSMSFRSWVSVITIFLLLLVVYLAWPEIVRALRYLNDVNLWILALMVPAQFISYFSTGEMIFSYLRSKGPIKHLTTLKSTRMALEFNFVNHVFPSGGAAGISYMAWQLGYYGISAGRATMAQVIRFVLTFISFVIMLILAMIFMVLDHSVGRSAIFLSLLLVFLAFIGTILVIYIVSSRGRLRGVANWLTKTINHLVKKITRGKKQVVLRPTVLLTFFDDIHDDYLEIRRDKKILLRPFLWSVVANCMDVVLLYIAFWSFGFHVSPAMLFIAFGLSSIASAFAVTPGGAGVYETIMIAFLASAGVPADTAIAGTLLARVLLMVGTIAFGYVFYQLTILKYGKHEIKR